MWNSLDASLTAQHWTLSSGLKKRGAPARCATRKRIGTAFQETRVFDADDSHKQP